MLSCTDGVNKDKEEVEKIESTSHAVRKRDTFVDYYVALDEEDAFVDIVNLNPLGESQKESVAAGIKRILQDAENDGMSVTDRDSLLALVK